MTEEERQVIADFLKRTQKKSEIAAAIEGLVNILKSTADDIRKGDRNLIGFDIAAAEIYLAGAEMVLQRVKDVFPESVTQEHREQLLDAIAAENERAGT